MQTDLSHKQAEWKPPFESHAGSLYAHRKVYFCFHKTENVSAEKGFVLNLIK